MARPHHSPRIAVIGAGFGGIATAVHLKRAGFDHFTVYEKADGPGGVWWHNTYPGCEVDIPSHAYSFSFITHDWSGTHAKQDELQQYAEEVIRHFDLKQHFQYGTAVVEATWRSEIRGYAVRLDNGGEEQYDVVVSAVGLLSHPSIPDWPGAESFRGRVFHTSNYDHDVDLTGKRVAIVGTGSSACQLAPAIAERVGQLDVYQREAGYVLPKRARSFDADERARFVRYRILQRLERVKHFRDGWKTRSGLRTGSQVNRHAQSFFEHHLAKTVRDEAVREALTPRYPFGCKRPVYATGFLPMFNRDNVSLVPNAVARVEPDGLVDATGTRRPADVVILATGFQTTRYLATFEIRGSDGVTLREHWRDEPWAFLGLTVPGYPNFFMLYGPNTNGGFSLISQLEIQAAAVCRALRRLRDRNDVAIDTRPGVARLADRWVQQRIAVALSATTAGCHTYYHAASGKNVTQWPGTHTTYRLAVRLLSWLALHRIKPDCTNQSVRGGTDVQDLQRR